MRLALGRGRGARMSLHFESVEETARGGRDLDFRKSEVEKSKPRNG